MSRKRKRHHHKAKVVQSVETDTPPTTPAPIVMREQLSDIGVILDLPTKRPTRNTAAVEAVEYVPASSRRWSQWASVAVLVVSALIATVAWWPEGAPRMPDSVLGDWVTEAPQYEGRRLAFTPTEVLITTGADIAPTRHRITSLQLKRHADSTVLAITYTVDGAPVEMRAAVMETGPQRLIFARPVGLIWERPTPPSGQE